MSTKTIYLTGTTKWAKVYEPDLKYKRWSLDLFPDEASWKVYDASGLELMIREDEGSEEGKYIRLSRPTIKVIKDKAVDFEPVELLDDKGAPLSDKYRIGNGSNITCKVVVYDTVKGKGHRLEAVRVNILVKFEKPEVDLSNEDSPF